MSAESWRVTWRSIIVPLLCGRWESASTQMVLAQITGTLALLRRSSGQAIARQPGQPGY